MVQSMIISNRARFGVWRSLALLDSCLHAIWVALLV